MSAAQDRRGYVAFRHQTSEGTVLNVTGGFWDCHDYDLGRAFRICVREATSSAPANCKIFGIGPGLRETLSESGKREIPAEYYQSLRYYAILTSLEFLNKGSFNIDPVSVPLESLDRLKLRRFCEKQEASVSGELICQACSKQEYVTTLAVCKECDLPDPWEVCAHITNIRTTPLYTDQHGLAQREVTASCNLGKRPGEHGGIPRQCRARGEETPDCFEPRTFAAPLRDVPKRPIGFMEQC